MKLFTVRIYLNDERLPDIPYSSIMECLQDDSLRELFDSGEVTGCLVFCGVKRMTGCPISDWHRFTDSLVSTATSIFLESFPRHRKTC